MKKHYESSATTFLSKIKSVLPDVARDGYIEDLNEMLLNRPDFNQLAESLPASIAIFSYASMSYEYFSPNMEILLGYPLEKLKGMSGAEFALSIFNPEHLNILVNQTETIKNFYAKCASENRVMDTRCTWTAQIKNAAGNYLWTLHQTSIIQVTPEGFPLRSIIFVSDITDVKVNDKVDFIFAVKATDGTGYETSHISSHQGAGGYVLSEREIEVLTQAKKGLSNQEIADALNLSKHTVTTHKRNIMRKTGKHSIIQLLVE